MKICTVVGARPQFVKAAPVSRILAEKGHQEVLIHTGQHYDRSMSDIFFEEVGQMTPAYNLGIGSASHGVQTGQMMVALEPILQAERPDAVLVYGDTNSTLAAALVAAKLHQPVAHVEAGLRSYNRSMPEEYNRLLTDHISTWLFCPTPVAVENLKKEGIRQGVYVVGDVMYDAVLFDLKCAEQRTSPIERLNLMPGEYYLATVHRSYNTDEPSNLAGILTALGALDLPVVFPLHPRTRNVMQRLNLKVSENILLIEPVGHLEMLLLEKSAAAIITDSGGVQKEAYFFAVPCVTIRPETEWIETVQTGWNVLAEPHTTSIRAAVQKPRPAAPPPPIFGDGRAAEHIVERLTHPDNEEHE